MPQISAPSVMRAVLASDEIGLPVEPSRRGDAMWTSGDLEYRAWVDRVDGKIECETNIGDARFAERMAQYGRMSVMVRSANPPRDWPVGRKVSADMLAHLVGEFRAEFDFVSDRADLCWLLPQQSDVHRGHIYAWLPRVSYPGRLVKSLILARDAGLADLEKEIREKLASGPILLSDGSEREMVRSARQWAKRYGKGPRLRGHALVRQRQVIYEVTSARVVRLCRVLEVPHRRRYRRLHPARLPRG